MSIGGRWLNTVLRVPLDTMSFYTLKSSRWWLCGTWKFGGNIWKCYQSMWNKRGSTKDYGSFWKEPKVKGMSQYKYWRTRNDCLLKVVSSRWGRNWSRSGGTSTTEGFPPRRLFTGHNRGIGQTHKYTTFLYCFPPSSDISTSWTTLLWGRCIRCIGIILYQMVLFGIICASVCNTYMCRISGKTSGCLDTHGVAFLIDWNIYDK